MPSFGLDISEKLDALLHIAQIQGTQKKAHFLSEIAFFSTLRYLDLT